jgi:Protein of unknown function (DUF3810)
MRLWRRLFTICSFAVLLGAMWLMARSPTLIESVYARGVGFQLSRALSSLSGVLPFSLAEIALAGVVLYFVVPFFTTTSQVLRRKRSLTNALAGGVLRVAAATVVILFFFYVLWGLNYSRAPLPTRLGWTPLAPATDDAERERRVNEIETLAAELMDVTNAAYRAVTSSDDLGRPSERPSGAPGLDIAIDAAFARVQERLKLENGVAASRGRAKPIAGSIVMSYLGLTGFYFPWTGEANYNRLQPAPTLAHSVAHEKAHQRGFAPEDEASFIGYLTGAMSDDPYAHYSAAFFAQRELVAELARYDLTRTKRVLGRRLPGVWRDLQSIHAYWGQYEGPATRVSQSVNDRYLKSQGMKRGIATYADSRNLIVLFARQNGGKAWPGK